MPKMTKKELEAKFKEIVVDQLGVRDENIKPDTSFVDDLGADSLDCVELVMACEEEFGFGIPEEDCEGLNTVQKTLDYLAKRLEITE